MDKLVSIIVPVYQGEKTIERCLNSILGSNYKLLEVIAVDDGSTDNTANIIKRIAERDSRLRYIRIDNGGVSRARNTGLRQVRGEFIGFVDSDDYVSAEMYEKMIAQMTTERDLIVCGCYQRDEDGQVSGKVAKLVAYEKKSPQEALTSVLYERVTMAVWSKLFRRKYIVSKEGELTISFQENLSHYEDFIFICEYIQHCKGNMYFLPERLYNYCYFEGSLSREEKPFADVITSLSAITGLQQKYKEKYFKTTELFYTETVWKYWIVKLLQMKSCKRLSDFVEHKEVKLELERYRDTYYSSGLVKKYKKLIVKMILSHEALMFFLVKMGRAFWRK